MLIVFLFSDPSGKLNFDGKAVLHAQGVDFSNGNSYKINMDEFELLEELGKGQFGTVQKVFHRPTNVTMAMKVGFYLISFISFIRKFQTNCLFPLFLSFRKFALNLMRLN